MIFSKHLQTLEVNNAGVRIHAHHLPNKGKPALVALHGLTDDGLCWLRLARALRDDFDIVMPDARGHGLSDTPAHGYTAKDHAGDAAAVIRAMGLGPCIVIGHSMGGAEAAQLAADYPELVRALILEDPAWRIHPALGNAGTNFGYGRGVAGGHPQKQGDGV